MPASAHEGPCADTTVESMPSPDGMTAQDYDEYLELPEFRDRGWRLVREHRLDPDSPWVLTPLH